MRTQNNNRTKTAGSALLASLVIGGIAALTFAATVNRSLTNGRLNQRTVDLSVGVNAAEAATEKVVARLTYDFQSFGPGAVVNNLSIYRDYTPEAAEDPHWTNFVFSDGCGNIGRTYVNLLTNYTGSLPSQYPGLFTANAPVYRIISNARPVGSAVVAAVQEDVLLALIPISQYAIFYNSLLEFSTCQTMTVNGRTHANAGIYTGTSASLTFNGTVTTTGTITSPAWNGQGPNWANKGTYRGTPSFRTNVPTVALSINMTNARSLIEIPSAGESPTSAMGTTRLFNKAQTVLMVSNATVSLEIQQSIDDQVPGADPSPVVLTSTNTASALATNFPFLTTTSFTDQRENKTVLTTQIDVGRYASWIKTSPSILSKFPEGSGTYPTILFVADNRTTTASQITGVRLTNGTALPVNGGLGWTVATPNPLYVIGHYNCTNSAYLGTTNTSATVPAALMSDALTVLSSTWRDSASASSYSTRDASDNTVNAAILTGNVPSTGSSSSTFSGGVHNLTRLLEKWSGNTLTLNTSLLNLFASQKATHQFVNPGTYYDAPTRQFSYDINFANPNRQPPGIPCALVAIRLNWATPPPNTITYNVAP